MKSLNKKDMNFEELKSEWDKAPENEVKIPEKLELLRKSELPIELIKKMMKKEFLIQSLSIIFIGILPFISSPFAMAPNLKAYYLGFFVLLIISSLFIYKFYKFYNYLLKIDTGTKDSLYEVYYELKLNLEAYKTWSYLMTPFLILMMAQFFLNKKIAEKLGLSPVLTDNIIFLTILILLSAIYMYYVTNWWIKKYYQNHVDNIKNLIDQLKES